MYPNMYPKPRFKISRDLAFFNSQLLMSLDLLMNIWQKYPKINLSKMFLGSFPKKRKKKN